MRCLRTFMSANAAMLLWLCGGGSAWGECPCECPSPGGCSVIGVWCSSEANAFADALARIEIEIDLNNCSAPLALGSGQALSVARARGETLQESCGACGGNFYGQCFDADLDADVGGPIVLGTLNLSNQAAASVGPVNVTLGEATANGIVKLEPLKVLVESHATAFAHSFSYSDCPFICGSCDNPTRTYSGGGDSFGFGLARAMHTLSFSQVCNPIIKIRMTMSGSVTLSKMTNCPTLAAQTDPRLVLARFLSATVDTSSPSGMNQTTHQGVFAEFDDGSTLVLGDFNFMPPSNPTGHTLNWSLEIAIPVPAGGADDASAELVSDAFMEFDGDIDHDGKVCATDASLMQALQGVTIQSEAYTPRADFDLNGVINASDQAAFDSAARENSQTGPGCAGLGGFVPELAVLGCVAASESVMLDISKGPGGSSAFLGFGLTAASTPIGGGCFLNVTPLLPVLAGPLPLSGVGPGAGQISLPVVIPASATPGKVAMQAFVADSASSLGFTTTNAVVIDVQ